MADSNALQTEIVNILAETIGDGSEIKNVIQENIKKAINNAVIDAFKWGDIKRTLDAKIKETLVPAIESSDFSVYIPRLDAILTELVNDSSVQSNRRILEHFKTMVYPPAEKVVSIEDVFKRFCEYAAKSLDTNGRNIVYEDDVSYEDIECVMEVEDSRGMYERRGRERWLVSFHVNEDDAKDDYGEPLALSFILYRFDWQEPGEYSIISPVDAKISSLHNMSDFEVYIASLATAGVHIKFATNPEGTYLEEYVTPENKPEPTYE